MIRFAICLLLLAAGLSPAVHAQSGKSRVTHTVFKDGPFGFTKQKAYPWYIVRHEDGTFENANGEKLEAADTIPAPVSAHCKTNVQGEYVLDECTAGTNGDTTWLVFGGGMPAYASSFTACIVKDSVTVVADLVYPSPVKPKQGKVLKQVLQMERKPRRLRGYIDFAFLMEGSRDKYYLRGFFSTPVAPVADAVRKNDQYK